MIFYHGIHHIYEFKISQVRTAAIIVNNTFMAWKHFPYYLLLCEELLVDSSTHGQ